MSIKKTFVIIGAVLVVSLVSACGKNAETSSPQEQARKEELIRGISDMQYSAAKSLAVINPKHDEKYYLTRLSQISEECVKEADVGACFTRKSAGLRNE